jgi:hypothetical protein
VKPQPIVFAAAFDPDGWKRISNEMISGGRRERAAAFVVFEGDRAGRPNPRRDLRNERPDARRSWPTVVIDTTGDLDVAAAAGAKFIEGAYIVTDGVPARQCRHRGGRAFRLCGTGRPFAKLDRQAKRTMGGSWEHWWLKTPLPGFVWCNCPHMTGYDGLKVEDLTRADFEGRKRIYALVDFVRANMPGFKDCFVVDVAPQLGIRQTRLLEGEYVVTKDDVMERVYFPDTVARGRDYYTPYRSMLPKEVEGLIVAGRHYFATEAAQKMSREIPPCMSMGSRPASRRRSRFPATCRCAGSSRARSARKCARRAAIRATGPPPMPS